MKNGRAGERFKLNFMDRKIVDRKRGKIEVEGKLRAVSLFQKSPFLIKNLEEKQQAEITSARLSWKSWQQFEDLREWLTIEIEAFLTIPRNQTRKVKKFEFSVKTNWNRIKSHRNFLL